MNQFQTRLHEALAIIYATRGQHQQALDALVTGNALRGLCAQCMQAASYFEPLHDMPGFQALLADIERSNESMRQQLAAAGLLLTPDEVLQHGPFTQNPYAP